MSVEVSAILTTRNRAHLLPRVLGALEQQTLPADRFEIVAIDDGSTDETPAILAAWQGRLPLRIFRPNHAGLAAAKNLGIFAAVGPILVFLDDDDIAQPGLLEAHLGAHLAYPDPATAVLGFTDIDPAFADLPVMRHVTQVGCQLFSYGWMRPGQVLDHTAFWGGRSSCKRGLLIRHGVFHPDFTFGCEDIELGWRLARHGLKVIYEPRAHATMIRALSFGDFCQRSYRQGRSQYRFAGLHADPAVRRYCEIDAAQAAWQQRGLGYAPHRRWTAKLERLQNARLAAGRPAHDLLQQTLDEALREAFFLSRAKGVADAAALARPAARTAAKGDGIFEYGL